MSAESFPTRKGWWCRYLSKEEPHHPVEVFLGDELPDLDDIKLKCLCALVSLNPPEVNGRVLWTRGEAVLRIYRQMYGKMVDVWQKEPPGFRRKNGPKNDP